ncbi:MAG: hypothetical protein LBR22_10700 [Desulfovibrio sp.]|jgi:uncharacterized membrane protein YhiD involved in acid resistance|nr:hypothetical protein [Desulfovibrio sp.]
MKGMQSQMQSQMGGLQTQMDDLRTEMHEEMKSSRMSTIGMSIGAVFVSLGICLTLVYFLFNLQYDRYKQLSDDAAAKYDLRFQMYDRRVDDALNAFKQFVKDSEEETKRLKESLRQKTKTLNEANGDVSRDAVEKADEAKAKGDAIN